jgi:hypothetical protein
MQNGKKTLSFLVTAILAISMILAAIPMAMATFTISKVERYVPPSWVDITSAPKGNVGDMIRVTVDSTTPGGLVKVYWDSIKDWDGKAGFLAQAYAVGTTAIITFNVPAAVNGTHTIIAKDIESNSIFHVNFDVQPKVVAAPPSVLAGDTVNVLGSGFAALKDAMIICHSGSTPESLVKNETISGSWGSTSGSGILAKKPIKPNFVVLNVTNSSAFSKALGFRDDGAGKLILNFARGNTSVVAGSGTIDYVTGSVSLTWNWALSGTRFANATYTIYNTTATAVISSVPSSTSELGSLSASFMMPVGTSPGTYNLFVIDGTGKARALGTITVVKSVITLTPTSGLRGSSVTVAGRGFGPGKTVDVLWYMAPSQNPYSGDPTADTITVVDDYPVAADGTFTATFNVPTVGDPTAPGTYYWVKAVDTASPANFAGTNFKVVSSAKIVLSPTAGYVGTTVGVTGTWFSANSKITLKFGDLTVATTPSVVYTAGDGSFYASFKVPTVAKGEYTVTATDDKGVSATAKFTVTEPITEIYTRSTTYTQGDQVSVHVKSTESIVGIKLVIKDPTGLKFWEHTITSTEVVTDPITGFKYLNSTVLPPRLPDDAMVGSWNFTAYDPTGKKIASNLFTVNAKTAAVTSEELSEAISQMTEQLNQAITQMTNQLNQAMTQMTNQLNQAMTQMTNQITSMQNAISGLSSAVNTASSAAQSAASAAQSAASAAQSAASAAQSAASAAQNAASAAQNAASAAQSAASAASAAKTAAESAKSAADSAVSTAQSAVSAANAAKSAADTAASTAESAVSAANAAKSAADTAASTAESAVSAAESAKAAAEGLTMPVWVAVVLSLISAIAAILAIITIRGKIAG